MSLIDTRSYRGSGKIHQYSRWFVKEKNCNLRKLAEENIRLKEEMDKCQKYAQALLSQSITAIAIMDKNYNFIQVNERYAQADFRRVDDFPGHNHFEYYPSEAKQIFDNVIRTKETFMVFAAPFIYHDHPERGVTYWDWTLAPVLDAEGEVELLILNLNDVTRHVIDKAKMAESEERYRVIYENSLDGILLATTEGTVISANPAACSLFGASEEELIQLGRKEMVDFQDPKAINAFEKRRITGSYFSEIIHVRKDGRRFPTEVTSKLFKDSKGRILSSVIIRDISDRKKSEAALRRSEEKFSKAFENNQAAMSFTRLEDATLIDMNRKFLELTEYGYEELINKSGVCFWLNPQNREEMLREIHKVGYVENFETYYRKKSGDIGSCLIAASVLNLDGEKYLLCSMIDITERKKTEEALKLSQRQFYTAFNANPLPMGIISVENGRILEVNETSVRRNDFILEELIKLKFLEEIKENGIVENFEVSYRNRSGDLQTVLLSGVIMHWKGEECILAIANDITALRRCEHEMTRLDRLNLIGNMSASIAHEIRNPMTTVKGFLQLFKLKDRYLEDQEHINLMIEELDRANSIITEFLSLAKDKDLRLKRENLNEKILTFLPLLQADALKNNSNIILELGNIPNIMCDVAKIRQLILNLVRNGIEAMPMGGNLIIKTFQSSDQVNLVIQDQGSGIPPEVMEKIATPFFTTKDLGTGLGLAICYSIAERHNARIEADTGSEGTAFTVTFLQADSFGRE